MFLMVRVVDAMLLTAVYYIWNALKLEHLSHRCFPCDRGTEGCFRDICRELQECPEKIRLGQSYHVPVPMLKGVCRSMIMLLAGNYDKTSLRVILAHELVHYKQKDHWTRWMANIVTIVRFFNPCTWMLSKKLQRQGEYACDEKACGYIGNGKIYFGVILSLAEKLEGYRNAVSLQVVDHESELKERIRRMADKYKGKNVSKRMGLLLCRAIILGSSIPVSAAAGGMAKGYELLYFAMEEGTEEPLNTVVLEEYTDDGYDGGVVVERGEIDRTSRAVSIFN